MSDGDLTSQRPKTLSSLHHCCVIEKEYIRKRCIGLRQRELRYFFQHQPAREEPATSLDRFHKKFTTGRHDLKKYTDRKFYKPERLEASMPIQFAQAWTGPIRPGISAETNVISIILDPLGASRFPELYQQYAPFVDFVLYLFLFLGVTRSVLGERFKGSGGRILINALGIILAIALAVTGQRMNFRIADLGVIAVAILLGVLGILLYRTLIQFGVSNGVSGSVAFLLIYSAMRGFSPSLFDWLTISVPIIAAFLSLALLLSTCTVLYSFLPKNMPSWKGASVAAYFSNAAPEEQQTKNESEEIGKKISGLLVEDADTLEKFQQLRRHLPELMKSPEGRDAMARVLKQISDSEHKLLKKIEDIKTLDQAMQQGQLQVLRKTIADLSLVPRGQGTAAVKAVKRIREESDLEKVLKKLTENAEKALQGITLSVGACARAILDGDAATAQKAILQAVKGEKNAQYLIRTASSIEQKLHNSIQNTLKAIGEKAA